MNEEKSDLFNILDRTIKQAAHELPDVGKTPANVAEC